MSFLPCSSSCTNVKYRGSGCRKSKEPSVATEVKDEVALISSIVSSSVTSQNITSVNNRSQTSQLEINRKLSCSSSNSTDEDKMRTVSNQSSSSRKHCINSLLEIALRIILFVIFVQLERSPAFKRKIHPDELWLYKNPVTPDIVPASVLLPCGFIVPFIIVLISYLYTRDKYDFVQANNAVTLALALNGVITSSLKITVGRPRPDFFYRCFPDGIMNDNEMECTGPAKLVNEGRKSFPSGHSSFAFTGFGFIFLYLAAKLHVFNERGRGITWRFCIAIIPLYIALLIAISRTCDYHHHWQDVTVGSFIGISITYLCYRQYYPALSSVHCHRPYPKPRRLVSINGTSDCSGVPESTSCRLEKEVNERQPLIADTSKDNKWI